MMILAPDSFLCMCFSFRVGRQRLIGARMGFGLLLALHSTLAPLSPFHHTMCLLSSSSVSLYGFLH